MGREDAGTIVPMAFWPRFLAGWQYRNGYAADVKKDVETACTGQTVGNAVGHRAGWSRLRLSGVGGYADIVEQRTDDAGGDVRIARERGGYTTS